MDPSQNDLEALRRTLAELTARVYQIERKLHMDVPLHPATPPPVVAGPFAPTTPPTVEIKRPVSATTVSPVAPPAPSRPSIAAAMQPESGLEARIGSHWLNRIGITALLIGISYFLKFAFENNWIGPAGRITIGLLAGIGVVLWSERFRAKGYKAFSYSLKAVGIGTLYLSLWAAFQVYSLIPSGVAFAMMLAVTAATAAMAWSQDAQILAAFALTGGFTTPLLLSTGQNREVALFSYVAILDVATLLLVMFKPWRRLLVMGYVGTLLLYVGWYSEFYNRSQLGWTLGFATGFFAIFAIAPLVTLQPADEHPLLAAIPAILAFVNAGAYFLQAYVMINEINRTYMAWFALALAGIYIFLSRQVHARNLSARTSEFLYFLHLAVAIAFITVAIPIRLDAHWITIGWFIEAAVLLWVGNRMKSDFLSALALGALVLGVARLLLIDNFQTTQLVFNMRMATYLVAIIVLGAVAHYASKSEGEPAVTIGAISVVALNLLALFALTQEVGDYFRRQIAVVPQGAYQQGISYIDLHRNDIQRDFTYSALWMLYGSMLMVVGFVRRSALVRWQALILIAATIAKVFIYDVSQLDRGYRIVSFMVLGVLLMAISFVYQRDWLQLSKKTKAEGVAPNA